MSTIDSRDIIIIMLKNDGVYPGDSQVRAIFSYICMTGKEVYKIIYGKGQQILELYNSPFCKDIKLLWDNIHGLTDQGRELINKASVEDSKE